MPGYLVLAAAVVGADQLVKWLVRGHIALGAHVSLLPGLMDLTYVQNTGAAFSMFSAHTWLLTVLSAVLSVAFAVVLVRRMLPHWTGMLAMALLLGGAVGNLIDRAVLGFVTDMFATTFIQFAVFNVADIGVVLGGILLCIDVLFFSGKERKA